MPAYQAVLFDFFGTLTRAVRRGTQHAAVARALGCDPAALIEVLDQSFRLRATGALGDAEATWRWAGEQAGARPTGREPRAARQHRVAAVRADTRLHPEATRVLCALRRLGLRTGLVSDCTHELPAFLPALPVARLLDTTVFSAQVGRCKPDREIFLAACHQLGVPPSACLYVGDGGGRELTGATSAGLTAVRLAAPDLATHLVFDADRDWTGATVTSLRQLPQLAMIGAGGGPRPMPPSRTPAFSPARAEARSCGRMGR